MTEILRYQVAALDNEKNERVLERFLNFGQNVLKL